MSEAAYEINPPLSVLLYAFPVLAEARFGVSLIYTILLQSLFVLAVSTIALHKVLQNFIPKESVSHFAIMCGYLIANTMVSGMHFGERDHLLGMVLVPFVLIQLSYNLNIQKTNTATWAFLLFGAIFLLLKPYYGIFPIFFLLHRLYKTRNFSVLKSPDFIALSCVTTLYLSVIWLFFRDYVFIILPDVLKYYHLSFRDENLTGLLAGFVILSGGLYAVLEWLDPDRKIKRLGCFMILCGLACLIPAIIQNIGYYYHFLPFMLFFVPVCSLVLFTGLFKKAAPLVAMIAAMAALVSFSYSYFSLPSELTLAADYANLPLPQKVIQATKQKDSKSFLIFSKDLGMPMQMAYFTQAQFASRFAGIWFLPGLYIYQYQDAMGQLTPEQSEALKKDINRFGAMIGEDINRYKPEIILVVDPSEIGGTIDLPDFFKNNATFRSAWSKYRYDSDLIVDEKSHFGHVYSEDGKSVFHTYLRESEN